MAHYRKIDVRIWNDEKFAALSDNGKLLFLFLLTHPNLTCLGAMRTTQAGLMEELHWQPKAFREAFQEVLSKGIVKVDERACYLEVTNFLKYNRPESPNVVKSWAAALDLIPECRLKVLLIQKVKAFVEGLSKGFQEALPEAFRKGMPNQEQEQEQEQEQDNPQTPKGDVSEMPLPMLLNTARFRSAWREWVAYRKEIRKPLKPTTAEKQLEALSKYGVDLAIEKIQTAITNGWQGVVFQGDNKRRFAADEDNLPCYRPAAEVLAEQKLRG